jgi:hypothetical protein
LSVNFPRIYALNTFVAAVSALFLANRAPAQYALFTASERDRLIELARDDASAHAQSTALIHRADAALRQTPNPIDLIQTEGKLAGDPVKVATQAALRDMQELTDLGYAYLLTGDSRYADKARLFILAWARINQPTGDPIDETNLEPLIVSYDLTRSSYSDGDKAAADGYLRRLIHAEWSARQVTNNWQSHRLKIVGIAAYVLGDDALIARAIDGVKRQINVNLNADGSSYDFIERDALHYHIYDLEPLLTLAIAASKHGLDLYDFTGARGGSLRQSVHFLIPYCTGAMRHHEFVNSKVEFDRKRAQNGESGYQIGHLFRPKEGLKALCLASYFDEAASVALSPLVGQSSDPTVQWTLLLNAASHRK